MQIGQSLHGFSVERIEQIDELRSQARILRHEKTGARLLHLVNDDPNNLFCIGFRTPVFNDTGVPHILEHSVLGGSRKFPVKDPFQVLLKSSLQTFLNAMTYPDKTIYPVSSQVEKDYFNLVDVYCDAVLHPLLTEHTFQQEGWHFDVEQPEGPVSIKGIVYNEMKGVFSDFGAHVARKTMSALFPDTTYYYESGGDPAHITDLTYEQFKDFHARYYHPSNSYIFLYGNIPTEKTLAFLQDRYLHEYEPLVIDSAIPPQPLWDAPRSVTIQAPCSQEDDGYASVIVSWIFGTSANSADALAGGVLARYLIATESSPLRRALIDSELGEDLDDLSGFDVDLVQGFFAIGLRKTRAELAQKVEALVFETLRREVEQGMDRELLEGSLRRVEFSLRELSGSGRYPYNLKLADRCFRSWIYEGDPLSHLAYAAPLEQIKRNFANNPNYFADIIRRYLLDNKHHLTSVVVGSHALGQQLSQQTEEQAAKLSASFDPATVAHHYNITQSLLAEQKKHPSAEALAAVPSLNKADLPRRAEQVPVKMHAIGPAMVYAHPIFTGGISYLDMGFDCTRIDTALLPYVPLYAEMLTRTGAAGMDYQQMAKRISLSTGGISSSLMVDETVTAQRALVFKCFFHGKALAERFDELGEILFDMLSAPRLDDTKLLHEIVLEMRNDLNSSVIGSGHQFASQHAAARLSPIRHLCEVLDGIEQLRFLDRLVKQDNPAAVVGVLRQIHRQLIDAQSVMISLTNDNPEQHFDSLERLMGNLATIQPPPAQPFALEPLPELPLLTGIEVSSSVNFVAKAWMLGAQEAPGLGHLALLCQNLSRGHLWDKVRVEGGAYGSFASYGSTSPAFSCASYRDPNLMRTLEVYEQGLRSIVEQLDQATVDQNIIGTIGGIDKPRSPHGKGFSETGALLLGKTPQFRQTAREAVLDATVADIRAKAQEILDSMATAVTVVGSAGAMDEAVAAGLALSREKLLG